MTDARAAKAWQRDDLGTLTELAGEEVKRTPLRLKQWVESENGSPRWVFESRELDELVRDEHTPWVWNGTHASPAPRGMWIGLVDGSWLTVQGIWLDSDTIIGDSDSLGCVELERSLVRALILQPAFDPRARLREARATLKVDSSRDRTWLNDADWIDGRVERLWVVGTDQPSPRFLELAEAAREEDEQPGITISARDRTIRPALSQVPRITLIPAESPEPTHIRWTLGLRDGSQLEVTSIRALPDSETDSMRLRLELASGVTIDTAGSDFIAQLTMIRSRGHADSSRFPTTPSQSGHVPLLGGNQSPDSWFHRGPELVDGAWWNDSLTLSANGTMTFDVPEGTANLRGWIAIPDGAAPGVRAQVFVKPTNGNWRADASWSSSPEAASSLIPLSVSLQGIEAIAINVSQLDSTPPVGSISWLDLGWEPNP
ncbi:MAG: hypothetical protein KDA83_13780 [Planctomycetales bacterium]|nr:hypothetical protein [Planctomycetales bacterium]